ncbi:MAG: hypothetical protein H6707_13925 [Deltaproteobacteria bacterium]|nr:hypothetical protein [Deltaproteobacteria bacterium]
MLIVVWSAALGGCSDVALKKNTEDKRPVFDDKLRLSGRVCTSDPADLKFPVKVLFVIDTSQSMNVNDPPQVGALDTTQSTGRSRSIRQVISQYIELGAQFSNQYCNTGEANCAKGEPGCAACASLGNAVCVGPDCCKAPPCSGVPACPAPTATNGSCLPLCDTNKAGCKAGESNCPDCPNPGDRCLNGVCGKFLDPGVEFAIIRFGSAKQVITRAPDGNPGFSNDPAELVTALPQVNNGGSVTDYEGALSEAFALLSRDMKNATDNNIGALNRTKYVVIFLSDGQPDPRVNGEEDWNSIPADLRQDLLGDQAQFFQTISEYNVPVKILRRVKEIVALRSLYGVGEITLSTAYIAGDSPSFVQDQATGLLKQMAQVGDGTFRNFKNGEELNFLFVDFSSLRRVFQLKNFMVENINGRLRDSKTVVDSDGDGLVDSLEDLIGTNSTRADTDADGFGDALEHFFRSSGTDALNPNDADCAIGAADADGDGLPDDTDGDGLLDCEERFIGTNRLVFDSDADGLPDGVEVRFGTNPSSNDLLIDLDFDGMPNGDEVRLHTDANADDAAHRSRTSYRYDVKREGSGIELLPMTCKVDADCPSGGGCSASGQCGCVTDLDCSTQTACTGTARCERLGELCQQDKCVSQAAACELTDPEQATSPKVCKRRAHVTCYSYDVENITLVSPAGDAAQRGWNTVMLTFAEAPFDNPGDVGNFRTACVRAFYDSENGAKLPTRGQLSVPETAWSAPTELRAPQSCICPSENKDGCAPAGAGGPTTTTGTNGS